MSEKATMVETYCDSCNGTGIYRGFCEPEGVGAVCRSCKGSGKTIIKIRTFEGRKTRDDIKTVQCPTWANGEGNKTGGAISYQDFLDGKVPS